MTFREALALYRAGALDEERAREVREAIDREDALLEYMAERDALPEAELGPDPAEDGPSRSEEAFQAAVNRGIRRAFLRLGTIVGAVLMAVLLLVLFVLPRAVDLFYYDPGATAGSLRTDHGSYETNRMSLDMAVYSELFLPAAYRERVRVLDRGYGEYDVVVVQNVTPTGLPFVDVAGHLRQGELLFYDPNAFKRPFDNAFEWCVNLPDPARSLSEQIPGPSTDEDGVTTLWSMGMAGYPDLAREALEALPSGTLCRAWITLDRVMDYESFAAFLDREATGSVWCAVQLGEKPGYSPNIGFCTDGSGGGGNLLCWDFDRYPALKSSSSRPDGGALSSIQTGEQAAAHLGDLLAYMDDHADFYAMMTGEARSFGPERAWLSQHGVSVYGFSLVSDRETLLRLQDCPEVYAAAAQPLR